MDKMIFEYIKSISFSYSPYGEKIFIIESSFLILGKKNFYYETSNEIFGTSDKII
jgi:hypothetical protein